MLEQGCTEGDWEQTKKFGLGKSVQPAQSIIFICSLIKRPYSQPYPLPPPPPPHSPYQNIWPAHRSRELSKCSLGQFALGSTLLQVSAQVTFSLDNTKRKQRHPWIFNPLWCITYPSFSSTGLVTSKTRRTYSALLWQKEGSDKSEISCKRAECICHFHWCQWIIIMSHLTYLSAWWVFSIQFGLGEEHIGWNMKTKITQILRICHLLPFAKVGQYCSSLYVYSLKLRNMTSRSIKEQISWTMQETL